MTSKKASSKQPKEKQPAGLWRGIAFGSLLTLTLGAGAAFYAYQNLPKPETPQKTPHLIYKLPVVAADGEVAPATQSLQPKIVKEIDVLEGEGTTLADIEGVTLALGEAFKLETQRVDALVQFITDQQDTINKIQLRLDDLERKNLEQPEAPEPPKASKFDRTAMLLISAYQQGLPINAFVQQSLMQANEENLSAEMIEALEQFKEATTPKAILLTDVYAYMNQLQAPEAGPTKDVSQTEQGWKAKLGSLVTITKIAEAPTNALWESSYKSVRENLYVHNYEKAVKAANNLDEDFAAFLQKYADQRHAFQRLISLMSKEGVNQ